jgi:hypothetical protein
LCCTGPDGGPDATVGPDASIIADTGPDAGNLEDGGRITCPPGQVLCGMTCVSALTDPTTAQAAPTNARPIAKSPPASTASATSAPPLRCGDCFTTCPIGEMCNLGV